MAHPKRKISKTRRDKRRTHDKITAPTLNVCPTTGKTHRPHQAVWKDGNLYYKGELILEKSTPKTA